MEGLVVTKNQGAYMVLVDGHKLPCAISNRLRKNLIYPLAAPTDTRRRGKRVQAVEELQTLDPVAVGDRVELTPAGDGTGLITEVLPRRNQLVRPKTEKDGGHEWQQVLVANIDQVVAIFSTEADPKWHLLDRYLVMAEAAGIPTLICLTKTDLVADLGAVQAEADAYRRIGYPVVLSSGVSGMGMDLLQAALVGKTSALIGKSGAGKTTLLNALQPGLGLRVKVVNQHTGEGQHATSHLELFDLQGGGRVIDTPGLRLFRPWGVGPDELPALLPELRPLIGRCKFGLGCSHSQEPGCAVNAAVTAGQVSARRYASYLNMKEYFGL